eukprot:scaffold2879_cov269-Prasinococcus_capsulatus_cf.AAC.27
MQTLLNGSLIERAQQGLAPAATYRAPIVYEEEIGDSRGSSLSVLSAVRPPHARAICVVAAAVDLQFR